MQRRTLLAVAAAVPAGVAGLLAGPPASAIAAASGGVSGAGGALPEVIRLPNGWQPEGIAIGAAPFCYVGSLVDGAVYRADLRTGRGGVLTPGVPGGSATGLEFDPYGRLWRCDAGTGGASVLHPISGAVLGTYTFGGVFVNDAVATRDAVYFTDSDRGVLYVVPLGRGGRLPDQAAVRTVALPGPLGEADAFNNGIETTPDGRLIIVQMIADRLCTYDPRTGAVAQVDLGGVSVARGDGLLRRGEILYVVRNLTNLIAKFRLNRRVTAATLLTEITSPLLQVPATVAAFGPFLYPVNARFDVAEPGPDTAYTVVRLPA
jgi:streptogramin lyase